MDVSLDPIEARVIGCLIEKQITTPDVYPLTLNGLELACNQTTNRDPVTSYDGGTIEQAIERLRYKEMIWVRRGGRATRYEHRFGERTGLGPEATAIMCVLMLRGPQTVGELRGRTSRLHEFPDLPSVEQTLESLLHAEPPFVTRLTRGPGAKESRYAHLLGGGVAEGAILPSSGGDPADSEGITAYAAPSKGGADRLALLESQIEAPRQELSDLRREFEELRQQLE